MSIYRFLVPPFLNKRIQSNADRRLLATFLFSVATLFLATIAQLTGFSGPQNGFFKMLIAALFAVTAAITAAFLLNKITLKTAFSILLLISVSETSAEMLIAALDTTLYGLMLIVGNMVLLAILVLFSMVARIPNLSYITGGISIATYLTCTWLTGNQHLQNFTGIYVILFLLTTFLSEFLTRNYTEIESENNTLKTNERQLLDFLNMDKSQLLNFIKLAKEKELSPFQTEELLMSISPQAKNDILNNVRKFLSTENTRTERLRKAFPELTASELEICQLILQDKKQGEICRILQKSASNITCQRSNIRHKLGLKKNDNLKINLLNRLGGDKFPKKDRDIHANE